MQQYLIALDLDGTIMINFSEYDEETFSYLRSLTDQGHLIVIATGRPYRSSRYIYDLLHLRTPMINYNGAIVHNPLDDKFLKTDLRIKREQLIDILDQNPEGLINVFCEINVEIFVNEYNEEIRPFLHVDGGILNVGPLHEILTGNPNGALAFVKPEAAGPMTDYIKGKYGNELSVRHWLNQDFTIVEIYSSETNKGAGIKRIAEYYNIPKENIIAIGDGHNDIEMFNEASIGVAMGNAHPELLKHATYNTLSCTDRGVLVFLKDFFKDK
jgi:Cof subfamily protein (haloacid dehalogenase superfamily)